MATYQGIYDRAHNNDFVNRVETGIVIAAIAISSEDPATANHANRVALAKAVLLSPGHYSRLMAVGVASDAAVQSTPTDGNLAAAISSQWNAYAGVS